MTNIRYVSFIIYHKHFHCLCESAMVSGRLYCHCVTVCLYCHCVLSVYCHCTAPCTATVCCWILGLVGVWGLASVNPDYIAAVTLLLGGDGEKVCFCGVYLSHLIV